MKFAILALTFFMLNNAATAAFLPPGTVIRSACAERVQTQVKVGVTGVALASSLCRVRIEGETKDYYTVDSDVWELLYNKITPPQVALVGKVSIDGIIVWSSNARMTIGYVEDDQTEVRLFDGKRIIIGEDMRLK